MKTTRFQIEVYSNMTLEYTERDKDSKFIRSDLLLNFIGPVDASKYFNKDILPNEDGCKCITMALVSAIANNIHYAHEKGYRDSAEHLRYIIAKLEEQFIQVPNISKGDITDEP